MQEAAVLESSLRLLCVTGDEQGVRRVVDEIPAPTFSLEYVSRYRDAIAAISTGRYDGCITDFMMRRGTALELLHVLHHAEYSGPVIVITEESDHRLDHSTCPLASRSSSTVRYCPGRRSSVPSGTVRGARSGSESSAKAAVRPPGTSASWSRNSVRR